MKIRLGSPAKFIVGFSLAIFRNMFWPNRASAAVIVSYNAALGTLPESQGFQRYEDAGYPAATVSGGMLHQYPQTATASDEYWYNSGSNIDFSTRAYALDADLHVISSNYLPNIGTGPRFGYYFNLMATDGTSAQLFMDGNPIT